ncbi:MAG TPA: Ig-like domain-containing protein [Chitinivibrionales bacterium]|nr:Ig-like domain-containing protein [Chitinivibrionales bacterium]
MVTKVKSRFSIVVSAALACFLLLLFCGRDSLFNKPESKPYGEVYPVLLFKKGASTIAVPPQVKSIRMQVMGAEIDTSITVPDSAHKAQITRVPVGVVVVTVEGLDSAGQVFDSGSVSVTIEANVVAQPQIELLSTHPIVLTFISPKNNDTLANTSATLSGTIDADYGLITFKMGTSEITVTGDQWSRNVDLVSGTNTFAFVAVDNKGNTLRDTLTLVNSASAHDVTGPVIALLQPADSSKVPVTPVTILGTATDPSGVLAVQVNRQTATLSGSSFSINQDLVPGKNTIIITAIDNSPSQNKSSDTFTVTLDTTVKDTVGPVFTVATPRNGDTVATATVMISGTTADISGVASLLVNGVAATIVNNTWSVSVPVAAGPNKLLITATDASPQHNVSRDSIAIVYNAAAQDKTLPSVAITSPSINTVVSNPLNITVTGTASDPAGIASVKVNGFSAAYTSGTWSAVISLSHPGSNAVWAVATDGAGNKDSTSINLIYDSTAADVIPPAITLVSHTTGQTVSVSPVLIQVTATDANGINWVTINGDTAVLNAGKYEKSITLATGVNQIKVLAQDKSTNRNIDTLKFTLTYDPTAADTVPPKITLVSHTNNQVVSSRNALIQVTATDANGIAWVTIMGDTAVLTAGNYQRNEVLVNGTNTIKVVAQDASSNHNKDTLVFTLVCDTTAADNTPPTITFVSPQPGQKLSAQPVLVQVTVSDQSGVALVTIGGDTVSSTNANYQHPVHLTQGSNTITVTAQDASPNHNKALQNLTVTYDSTLTDSTPPKISLVSLADSQVMSVKTVTVRLTATDANGISLVTLNGDTLQLSSNMYSETRTLAPGANAFKAYAIDASSNHNRAVLNFTLFYDSTAADTTPPTIALASPASAVNVSTATVSATITDASGISLVTINGVTVSPSGSNYSWSMPCTAGTNHILIVATDASTRKNQATLRTTFTYDPPPDAAVLATPTIFSYNSVHLTWSVSADNDFASYKVYHSQQPNVSTTSTLDTTITDVSTSYCTVINLQQNTKYYFKVFTVDKFPSTTPSNEVNATTTQVPLPIVYISSPNLQRDSNLVNSSPVAVSGTVSTPATVTSMSALVNGNAATVSGTFPNWNISAALNANVWNTLQVSATDNYSGTGSKTFWLFLKQPLNQPNYASVDSFNNTNVYLSWAPIQYCTNYTIFRSSINNTGPWTIAAQGLTGLHYADTGLTPGTQYWYAMKGSYSYPSGFASSDSTPLSLTNYSQTKFWFQKLYFPNTPASEGASVAAAQNGYFVFGTIQPQAGGLHLPFFCKLDSIGDTVFTYAYSSGLSWSAGKMDAAADKSFAYCVGSLYNGTVWTALVMKMSASGGALFSKTYNWAQGVHANCVRALPDGGCLVGGKSSNAGVDNVCIFRLDASGTLLWSRSFNTYQTEAYDLVVLGDGTGAVYAGRIWNSTRMAADIDLGKVSMAGDSLWEKRMPATSSFDWSAGSIIQASDGSLVIAGMAPTSSGVPQNYFLKTDATGAQVWSNVFPGYSTGAASLASVKQTSDGGYIAAGYAMNVGGQQASLMKLASDGSQTWQVNYGQSGGDIGQSVDIAPDGGFVVCGTNESNGNGDKLWLIKTDKNGGCVMPGP